MATPSRSKNTSASAASPRAMAKRTSTKGSFNLKNGFLSIALWGLGIINLLLIVSFASKFYLSGAERPMSSETITEAPTAENAKIEVLNGCGISGLARKYADLLKAQGFDPVTITNYEGGATVRRTYIYDWRSREMENGRKIAKILGLPDEYVVYQASPERQVAATLIIGEDYKQIPVKPK